ncbi:ComEC/Rec2-related protein [Phyllobacterium myrsinacearum]|uniref:Competence protein ComEC n=1 Tax=Phyllobacterium myrsinacearum TaxID=28101 RepID=A0A2S9JZI5_9HYPH|nr:competence protein ComEC [Phyllobacterium myrsinacearum]PWV96918.1 ComEC/Rec2-related protein [Phyllobacterium myrsinacearum]RZV09089.1 ComEC/Rec2-related protein [Phyllobacterium myrsinacearum]
MQGPATSTQTSERQFFDRPADDEPGIATQMPRDNAVGAPRVSLSARLRWRIGLGRDLLPAISQAFWRDHDRGSLFLFVPVFAGSGAIVYFCLPSEPRLSAILFGLTALAGFKLLAHERHLAGMCLSAALLIVAGMLCAKLETLRLDTPMLGSAVTTRLTGRIAAINRAGRGGWRVTVDVIATERPQLRYAPARLVVSARALPADAAIGSGLRGLVHLRPPSGPVRSGNYDFAFHNYYRGIGGSGFFLGRPEAVALPEPADLTTRTLLMVATMRQTLTDRIAGHMPGETGAIAASLITGQRDGISDATNNAMRLSGLSHILSISGLHMALVAGIVIGSLRAGMAFFPDFAARYPIKKFSACAALLASAFYLLLSGMDVAAQRSFVMLGVMLVAMTADRAALSLRNVALAALVTIAIAPHEVMGPSFQMSYSATAALIAFYGWWSPRRTARNARRASRSGLLLQLPGKIGDHVSDIALTSLVAGSASAIFAAYHFNNTAPLGLIGNAFALPVVSVLVMPFAVLALLLMPFDLDFLSFAVMERGIDLVVFIAHHVAALSPSGNPGPMPQPSLILMSVGLVILILPSSWLRLCSLPLFAAAALIMARAALPDIVLSEDGRLAGARNGTALMINRPLGGAFTLDNWRQGYGLDQIVKPAGSGKVALEGAFECAGKLCITREPGGLIIAYTDDPAQRDAACNAGNIVVLGFAGVEAACPVPGPMVITRRDLALNGAAEIRFGSAAQGQGDLTDVSKAAEALEQRVQSARLTFAIGPPDRPWNSYRIHSNAARNRPERSRKAHAAKGVPNNAGRDAADGQ